MTNKTIIERGASWTYDETYLLLRLWGEDLVQRQETKTKRTKEVYEKIAEAFKQNKYERTADQVRTRVFNMIAEYRRILRDNNNPERKKKCIFYKALDQIYQAKHVDDLKNALDDFEPNDFPLSPHASELTDPSDGEATDCNESLSNNNNNNNNNNNSSSNNNNNRSSKNSHDGTTATPVNSSATSGNRHARTGHSADDEKHSSSHTPTSNNNDLAGIEQSGENATNSRNNKRIKMEQSPDSNAQSLPNTNHKTNASEASTNTYSNSSNVPEQQNQSTSSSSNAKQNQASSATASPVGGTSSQTPNATPSTSSTSLRQQSLLLPHASTSTSASTPINKLTTTGSNNNTPSYININSTKLPIIRTNQLIGHANGNENISLNGTGARLPTTAAITSHQLYQAPVNTFDVTSSALLIDRMFAHLSRESENMREWIALEKERLALEKTRRQQEVEREVRRERVLIDTLMRFQDQWLSFITRLDPRIVENIKDAPPEFKIPPREGSQPQLNSQSGNAPSSNNDNVSQTTQNTTTSNNSTSSLELNKS